MKLLKFWILQLALIFAMPINSIAGQDPASPSGDSSNSLPFPAPEVKSPVFGEIVLGQTSASDISAMTGESLTTWDVSNDKFLGRNNFSAPVVRARFPYDGFDFEGVFYRGVIVELQIPEYGNWDVFNEKLVNNLRKDFSAKFKREKTTKKTFLQNGKTRRVVSSIERWTERNGAFSVEINEDRASLIVSKLACLNVAYELNASAMAAGCGNSITTSYGLRYRYEPGYDMALIEMKELDAARRAAEKEAEKKLRSKF